MSARREYTAAEKRDFVRKLAKGRAKARRERPKRLREVEQKMARLGREFRTASPERRIDIIHELRALGRRRTELKWSE